MNELMDSNEAAERDAIVVNYTEYPTAGQQIVSALIGVAVPLAAGLGVIGLMAVGGAVVDRVKTKRAEKKAAKELNTENITHITTPTE